MSIKRKLYVTTLGQEGESGFENANHYYFHDKAFCLQIEDMSSDEDLLISDALSESIKKGFLKHYLITFDKFGMYDVSIHLVDGDLFSIEKLLSALEEDRPSTMTSSEFLNYQREQPVDEILASINKSLKGPTFDEAMDKIKELPGRTLTRKEFDTLFPGDPLGKILASINKPKEEPKPEPQPQKVTSRFAESFSTKEIEAEAEEYLSDATKAHLLTNPGMIETKTRIDENSTVVVLPIEYWNGDGMEEGPNIHKVTVEAKASDFDDEPKPNIDKMSYEDLLVHQRKTLF